MHCFRNIHIRISASLLIIMAISLGGCARIAAPEGWSSGLIDNETLYIGTYEGELKAIDIGDSDAGGLKAGSYLGDQIWSFDLKEQGRNSDSPDKTAIYGTPVISGNKLYVGSYDGYMYVLSLGGDLLWEEQVGRGDRIVGGPTVADGIVLIGSSDGNLYALATDDLAPLWVFPTGNEVWATPVVSDGVVYFGSQDHSVYAVDLEQGTKIWEFRTDGAITAKVTISNDRVYIGSFDSIFYSLDADTGEEMARFEGANGWYWGGAVSDDTLVYAPSLDGNLYALELDTLQPAWIAPLETDGPIIGSPVIVGNLIAVPSRDGGVYLARLSDGRFEDQCGIDAPLRASLSVIHDTIYLSVDSSVRQLFVNSTGNFAEGWIHRTNLESNEDPVTDRWRCG